MKDEEEGWTTVKRRKGRRSQTLWGSEKEDDLGSDSDLDIGKARDEERDKVPGLYIQSLAPSSMYPFLQRLSNRSFS